MTFRDLLAYTHALDGPARADVFYALPAERQRECWDALASEWADHRARDWRGVREDLGMVA